MASPEYLRDLVASDYDDVFGHPAGTAILAPWVSRLAGGARDQSVLAGMLGSAQFFTLSGGAPAGFISLLYEKLLDRPVDPAGLSWWVGRLATGTPRTSVALAILSSPEYLRHFVENQYHRLLGHGPDAAELSFWVARLARGASEEEVIAGIEG